ncbi:MAG TPA: PilZ domain-containing protein [Terriglobales bacterium]|nr:PilZ domain-containing protein [Terriglobales bacterium]
MTRIDHQPERRKWVRLPLAIPVFVRSQDEAGKEFLEFATALNICAGGALVALRRSIPEASQIILEIPSAPLATTARLPRATKILRAKALRVSHTGDYQLLGLKFTKPLLNEEPMKRRKLASLV